MEQVIMNQLAFARNSTLKIVEDVNEVTADKIPTGFRNHIHWHLGHIYTVQERFAFHFSGLPMQLPSQFPELFASGTTPLNWTIAAPSVAELSSMLREQPQRIRTALEGRLNEKAVEPLTTKSGLTMETIGEFLNFTFYHEGMHTSVIKNYKTLLQFQG